MNTALVIRFDADGVELERERTYDEKVAYWSLVEDWLAKEGTGKVQVQRVNSDDVCVVCYIVQNDDDD